LLLYTLINITSFHFSEDSFSVMPERKFVVLI